jgi:hypothetical protein
MSDYKDQLDKNNIKNIRENLTYTSGILVNAGDVVAEFAKSPWMRSTTSINLYSEESWAQKAKASKIGFAVVCRSSEGVDYRTIFNPKVSWAGLAGNTGKTGDFNSELLRDNFIEAEINFAAGRIQMPTIIAGRTKKQPRGGTLTNDVGTPAPMVGDIGPTPEGSKLGAQQVPENWKSNKEKPQTPGLTKTSQGTNNATGTSLFLPSVLDKINKPNTGNIVKPMNPFGPGTTIK